MTDERSLWEQATESSYFAARKEERPDPPPEPLPETLPEPRPGEPTWRPGAAVARLKPLSSSRRREITRGRTGERSCKP